MAWRSAASMWKYLARFLLNRKNITLDFDKRSNFPVHKIIRSNKTKWRKCGDIIESTSLHDFKFCSCEACAVDGGKEYLRRIGEREDWEELSEFADGLLEDLKFRSSLEHCKARKLPAAFL